MPLPFLDFRAAYHAATAAHALTCAIATTHPRMGAVHLGTRRAVLYACFGVGSFLAPVMHGVWGLHGWDIQVRLGGWYVVGTAVFNGIGMGAYVVKVS